jgi:hypothetical protein
MHKKWIIRLPTPCVPLRGRLPQVGNPWSSLRSHGLKPSAFYAALIWITLNMEQNCGKPSIVECAVLLQMGGWTLWNIGLYNLFPVLNRFEFVS